MIEELYDFNEFGEGELSTGRPQWYKLWCEKYATALDIDNLDTDLTAKEKEQLFIEVGKAFINSLFYFMAHDEPQYSNYKPGTRDGRILWNALKRDIDQSYRDYYKRQADGRKGGRPKGQKEEPTPPNEPF